VSPELDRIHITDLVVPGIVGIKPDERVNKQDVLINATLWVDTRPAAASDDIADAVESGEPMLVERLVSDLATIALESDERISEVEVTVEKPGALRFADSAGITIRRSRGDIDA